MGKEEEEEEGATKTEDHSASADELKQKLHDHIDAARVRLDELKQSFQSLREEDRAALDKKTADLRQRVDGQKERGRQLRADLESWEKEKLGHTRDAITSWRQKRELARLEKRAERAEDQAVNAVMLALMDADEAEEAMFDAIRARIDVEAAAAPP